MLDFLAVTSESLIYLGIFALSFGANLIVFVPLPYLAIVLVAALSGRFDPILLILSSAIGSAIAKMVIYQACYTGQSIIKERTRENLEAFRRLLSRYVWIAVIVAASTPIPDDMVYVPLGFARYNRTKFFVSTMVGKLALVSVLVYGARTVSNSVLGSILAPKEADSSQLLVVGVIFAILTIVLTIWISRFDWYGWTQRHLEKSTRSHHLICMLYLENFVYSHLHTVSGRTIACEGKLSSNDEISKEKTGVVPFIRCLRLIIAQSYGAIMTANRLAFPNPSKR